MPPHTPDIPFTLCYCLAIISITCLLGGGYLRRRGLTAGMIFATQVAMHDIDMSRTRGDITEERAKELKDAIIENEATQLMTEDYLRYQYPGLYASKEELARCEKMIEEAKARRKK